MKPDVIKQMVEIEKSRKKEMEKMRAAQQQQPNQPCITFSNSNGTTQQLTLEQVVQILQQQQNQIDQLVELVKKKDEEINRLIVSAFASAGESAI